MPSSCRASPSGKGIIDSPVMKVQPQPTRDELLFQLPNAQHGLKFQGTLETISCGPLQFLGNHSFLISTLTLTLERTGVMMLGIHFIFYFVNPRVRLNRLYFCLRLVVVKYEILFAWVWRFSGFQSLP